MAKLITGGSGLLGAELAHLLVERGEDIIVFDRVKSSRLNDIEDGIRIIRGDLSNPSEVFNVVKDYKIKDIYHLGAILSVESETNPWASFQTNLVGTYNVLEAARLFNVEKVMFTSTLLTFDLAAEPVLTDTILQRPTYIYGVNKLYCEGLGRFYHKKFGLDFRSIRYPSVVGPGDITPSHWDGPMIEHAVRGETYRSVVNEDASAPMIYYRDAALAADMVLQAPGDSIKMMNYNVAGTGIVTAIELEQAIKKQIPGTVVVYPDTRVFHPLAHVKMWDDSYARREWGWKPTCSTIDEVVSAFVIDSKKAK
ncbi:NAD-dependent epimerase/dehydratase family protein [Chloroflexota bacterium]